MFQLYNITFTPITIVDESLTFEALYTWMPEIRQDFANIIYSGTYSGGGVIMDNDVVIRNVEIPPFSESLVAFEQYSFLPTGALALYNTVKVLNYNNIQFHKNNKYVLNLFPIVGEFITDITAVLDDGTNVENIYFEILERLTTNVNPTACLYYFELKDVSTINDLIFVCKKLSGGDLYLRFNIND